MQTDSDAVGRHASQRTIAQRLSSSGGCGETNHAGPLLDSSPSRELPVSKTPRTQSFSADSKVFSANSTDDGGDLEGSITCEPQVFPRIAIFFLRIAQMVGTLMVGS
jgi:hypothetical protein